VKIYFQIHSEHTASPKGILLWVGQVERMSEERTAKKVFKNIPEGKRFVGKPRNRCLYDVENDLKKINIGGWTKIIHEGGQAPAWTVQPMERRYGTSIKQTSHLTLFGENPTKHVHQIKASLLKNVI
jgi:hypothetical protein